MATITYVVDPLNIITAGIISGDPLNLITDGFVTAIIEEEIVEEEFPSGGGYPWDPENPWELPHTKKKKKKKITATIYYEGKEYKDVKYTSDLTLNVKDVKLSVSKKLNEIKVSIILPEGYENE